jgi:hypothetical protein
MYMNNKTILTMAFLLVGSLLTATMSIAPALAEKDYEDNHDDNGDWKDGRDGDGRDGRNGDGRDGSDIGGNRQLVEDESAGAIADCDKNEVERADFDCIAAATTEESEVGTGDGDDGDGNGDGNGEPQTCEDCFDIFLGELSGEEETAVLAAIEEEGMSACELDVETLSDLLEEVLGEGDERVSDLEECIENLVVIV